MKFHRGQIYRRTNGKCAYCGLPITRRGMTVDHIIPKAKFDEAMRCKSIPRFLRNAIPKHVDDMVNLFAACQSCNGLKADDTLEIFRRRLFDGRYRKFWFEKMHET